MKRFQDLVFKPHSMQNPNLQGWEKVEQARLDFDNGYGISVLFGAKFYSNGIDTYEVAVMRGDSLCYDTHITSDVIGYVSADEVTEIMKQVQELQP